MTTRRRTSINGRKPRVRLSTRAFERPLTATDLQRIKTGREPIEPRQLNVQRIGSVAEETKAVKKALKAAGFKNARVNKGQGTARNWIEITLNIKRRIPPDEWQTLRKRAISIAQKTTGRGGVHDGNIIVLAVGAQGFN